MAIKKFEHTTAKIFDENEKVHKAISDNKQDMIKIISINDKNHYDRFIEIRGCINASEVKSIEAVQRIENNLTRLMNTESKLQDCQRLISDN